MTIGDYIKEKFSIWSVELSDGLIEAELKKAGIDPSDVVTSEINTDIFFYNIIPDLLLMPTSVSEGGFSLSYDKTALTNFYSLIAKRLGKENLLNPNKITDITAKW